MVAPSMYSKFSTQLKAMPRIKISLINLKCLKYVLPKLTKSLCHNLFWRIVSKNRQANKKKFCQTVCLQILWNNAHAQMICEWKLTPCKFTFEASPNLHLHPLDTTVHLYHIKQINTSLIGIDTVCQWSTPY